MKEFLNPQEFSTPARDQEFKDWHAQHPQGFYLNERGHGEVMLHKVGCFHHGSGKRFRSTTRFKVGSDDREKLMEWAKKRNLKVVPCSSCKPE